MSPHSARLPRRDRALPWLPYAALAALVVLAWWLVDLHGQRDHLWLADEGLAVQGGRWLQGHFPQGLWDTTYFPRGPERLMTFIAAAVNAVAPTSAGEFQALHAIVALLSALVALPVYAIARQLGTDRWLALLPAAVMVLSPWALFGATLLNTTLGLLTWTLLVWAMWRALVRPSWRSDALVLAAVALVALARIGNAPLVVALAPAILVQCWRDRPAGQRVRDWLLRLPRTLWRRHPLLCVLAGAVVLVIAVKGPDAFLGGGGYGGGRLQQHLTLDGVWTNARIMAAKLAWNTGFVPFIVALPWVLREALRPRRREDGAFATLAVLAVIAFSYAYYLSFDEDRYMTPVLPLVAIAFGRAMATRGVGVAAVAVSGLLTARAVAVAAPLPDIGGTTYFFAPGRQFFDIALLGQLRARLPFDAHMVLLATLAAAAAAVVLVVALRSARARWTMGAMAAVLAGVLVYEAVAAQWSMGRWNRDATGGDTTTFTMQTFVDRGSDGGAVFPMGNNPTNDQALSGTFGELRFWNRHLADPLVQISTVVRQPCCPPGGIELRPDRRTGAVQVLGGEVTDRLLVHTGFQEARLDGEVVERSPAYASVEVFRARRPFQIAVTVRGSQDDGWVHGAPDRIKVFDWARRPKPTCLTGQMEAPPSPPAAVGARLRWSLRGAAGSVSGTVASNGAAPFRIPVADGPQALRLTSEQTPVGDRGPLGVRPIELHVGGC